MKISAVFFDMDGVILDSVNVWFNMFNNAYETLEGQEKITKEEFIDNLWGTPPEKGSMKYFKKTSVIEMIDFYNRIVFDFLHYAELFPESKNVLTTLRKKGIKTALITNTPRSIAEKMLENFKMTDEFDLIVAHGDVKHPKPSPDMIYKALEELGVSKEETLFVGDTKSDMNAGIAAGVKKVGISIDGDYRIENISEFLELLESIV